MTRFDLWPCETQVVRASGHAELTRGKKSVTLGGLRFESSQGQPFAAEKQYPEGLDICFGSFTIFAAAVDLAGKDYGSRGVSKTLSLGSTPSLAATLKGDL